MTNQVFAGTVQSGGTGTVAPLPGYAVTLYAATTGAPTPLGSAVTDDAGRFSIDSSTGSTDGIFYATAVRGGAVLVTVVGPEIGGEVVINELTTVAAAFSMAQFTDGVTIAGNAFGLRIAAMMNGNLVDPATGASSQVLLDAPNADQSNTLRSTRSLANLVAACVRALPGEEERFLELATPAGGAAPGNTFAALVSIARNPASNAAALFNQSQGVPTVYSPPLFSAPDAWTLAVKVNDSGDDDYLFGGPANVAFDRNGYAWVANNVVQGTPNSGNFIMVLRPDGRPADGQDGTPKSPVLGGGLIGPGWGVTIAPNGNVWVGNFGWGDPNTQFPVNGTVSEFDAAGNPLSGDAGYGGGGLDRAQAVAADAEGNIWIASFGSGDIVVFPGGDPGKAQSLPSGDSPFGIAFDADGSAWVSNSGGLGWPKKGKGSVTRYRLDDSGTLTQTLGPVPVGEACKVIATDSLGNAWVASGGDSTVYQLSPDGDVVGTFTGVGGMDAPWGLCIDGDDHVWVGNFGRLGLTSDYTTAALTKLAGANPATRPAGLGTGDPITPPTGYTLPSAGDPVLLHDGDPVYRDGTECYTPLMRMTSVQIDQAGNVWAVNNWKPRFRTDFPTDTGNPGGEGLVIFVGLAKPPKWPWAEQPAPTS
jgi:streptogramin lyase